MPPNQDDNVNPVFLVRPPGECAPESSNDDTKLALIDAYQDCTASMVLACFGPPTTKSRIIPNVQCYQDATFARRKVQQYLITLAVQRSIFIGGAHVVPGGPQRLRNSAPR
jgi:hypothetical protein